MCLALPMRIVAIDGDAATIVAEGLEQRASLMLVPQAQVGDYVLVHAGFALTVLSEDDAQETLALLAEIVESDPVGGGEGSRAADEVPDGPA
jgi:hydrogenase expression/formation protein HypC